MWHSDRPIPQQRLATELASLVAPLPRELFIPFLKAFWNTMAREWTSIDALRMDKFLRLVRVYVNAGFGYLQAQGWEMGLVEDYKGLIEEGPLSEDNKNSGDGLRYHVLDVWVDELDKVDPEREMGCDVDEVMAPVRKLAEKGKTSTVRKRAKESLNDERLVEWKDEDGERENGEAGGEDEEFDGFDE
jgi:ribosomal RNA-processing protein 1